MDDTIEIWAGGGSEASFMGQEEFGRALEALMGAGGAAVQGAVGGACAETINGE